MNRLYLFTLIFFFACQNTTVLPSYSGAINEIIVVVEDNIWESTVVDTLRRSLSAEVEGLAPDMIMSVKQKKTVGIHRFSQVSHGLRV